MLIISADLKGKLIPDGGMVPKISIKSAVVHGVLIFAGLQVASFLWEAIRHGYIFVTWGFPFPLNYLGMDCSWLECLSWDIENILLNLIISLFLGVLSVIIWPKWGKKK